MYASPQYVRLAAAYHWRLLRAQRAPQMSFFFGKTSNGVYRGWQLLWGPRLAFLGLLVLSVLPEPTYLGVCLLAGLVVLLYIQQSYVDVGAEDGSVSKVYDRARLQRWVWMALMVLLVVYNFVFYVYQIG